MSTDDERPEGPAVPRTRAEMRAAREAAAAAEAAEAAAETSEAATEAAAAATEAAAEVESRGEARRPAQETGSEADAVPARRSSYEAPDTSGAEKTDVAPIEPDRPTSVAPAPEASGPAPERAKRPSPRRSAPRSGTDEGPKRSRRFGIALAAVLGILVLVGAGFGVVSLTQGPRLTEVQVDPAHAVDSSGSRLILTTNQSLAAIDPAQVSVEPSVPFTVDAAGLAAEIENRDGVTHCSRGSA